MKKFLDWLFSLGGWCREHRKREGWDGYRSYVCPDCAETPRYRASLEEYLKTNA